ncbi:hypothetical protein [Pseudidiomarina terrestris]|uniref:Uncharacterized protein n=1 Tax=Pseudidiomarina terrestris TaxID=2820060 RepID=A0AAW7R0J6_9GAMM|nr:MULTISPECIES: hypothetical protein [unclassified Pseudidiomarina]MDN7124150.1 hypothetical protein [Pseudidiomarina sp. 1APP75-32.1]MDN7127217.1 hypothetical protein [Pseudidiomarina sp. 1APR75-33.1]MDN7128407.1 hypothetical protein [Pseudidiomarina sp. 1APR75-15]MDN7135345.1 hypothetical protein [Pseudidiomarina sp. 1ASP75-5]MDN7138605.1 hypothetical protein [Pseudidiomarina sp. 1ASP75-14]
MKFEAILKDPSAVYDKPQDVLDDGNLSRDEKCEILKQWEYDAVELQVATEENMPGPEDSTLDDILAAKQKLLDCDDEV